MFSLAHSDTASVDATVAWLLQRVPECTWVLQEYLMNPMTYRGHKFDLRIWAIVTSLDPLRVYLLGTGIPKVSQWVYTKQPKGAPTSPPPAPLTLYFCGTGNPKTPKRGYQTTPKGPPPPPPACSARSPTTYCLTWSINFGSQT